MVCFEEADPFVPALATHVPYTMGFQTHLSLLTASTTAASYPSLLLVGTYLLDPIQIVGSFSRYLYIKTFAADPTPMGPRH